MKIIIPGGAGLVGQNLTVTLKSQGYSDIIILDKHQSNVRIMQEMHPDITIECVDTAEPGEWQQCFKDAGVVVMLQAQIGSLKLDDFYKNNIVSTHHVLEAIKKYNVPYLIHVSSSVVNSVASDFYTSTKRDQENMVLDSGVPCVVLRPTLMFGWFDRKHLGWLSQFMKKTPIFPIPGNGRYIRQPLYVGDFCNIIISCIKNQRKNKIYNISGLEKIHYIDLIKEIKKSTKSKTFILKIPYNFFYSLLWIWARFDQNPPFTTQQLTALVAEDYFEITDWPKIFNVTHTPLSKAIEDTFNHPLYSKTTLEF